MANINILLMLVLGIFMLCVLQVQGRQTEAKASMSGRKLVVVSMDGFRYDYFEKANTPNFDAMMKSGVKVPYVTPSFPTLTFPSHTSIATGLYDESHGIVANRFNAPEMSKPFGFTSLESEWWDAGEPFWITAAKHGLKVGTFFWAGSDVDYHGFKPLSYRRYDGSIDYVTRVHTAVDWLADDDFDIGVLYFEEPDSSGHKYGPNDPRLIPVIERMDDTLGMLMFALQRAGIKDKVNVIVVSDHGMTEVDKVNKVVALRDHVDDTLLNGTVQWYGALVHLIPQPNKSKELVDALSNVAHMSVYLKEDVPERLHYSHSDRITPVIAIADEGWTVALDKEKAAKMHYPANHGFDNKLMSMKSIFVASGPSFKKGFVSQPIETVDIYPLICHLMGMKPAPNNGTWANVEAFLDPSASLAKDNDPDSSTAIVSSISLILVSLSIVVFF